ncbi:hypothetical protein JTE90_003302 [Oedothorax gibbosus]|uniref:Transcription termination factor 2 n=1 Tax=Oedothorax gibbosus TaxID=931172 RepID=A0AAV6TWA2_9ARAC|nr:hypothetical protein JTE90_003302 [Oedothorax gibbosus]
MEKPLNSNVDNHPRVTKTAEIYIAEADLENTKKILKSSCVNKLPDKGERLLKKVKDLEVLLDRLYIKEKESEESKRKPENSEKNPFSDVDKIKNSSANCMKNNHVQKDKYSSDTSLDTKALIKAKSSEVDKNAFTKPILKVPNSDVPSFADLNQGSSKNDADFATLVASPSFKTYRQPEKVTSIKLTEAKPLFEFKAVGRQNAKFTTVHSQSLASDETVRKLHATLCTFPEDAVDESEPDSLKTTLMRHQIKALSWLVWRERQQPSGGILADDMGLGKTLTIICLLLKQNERNDFLTEESNASTRGTLIVCLASIVHQWEKEISKHCKEGALKVLVYHGPKRDKDVKAMKGFDVVLTTYNILLSEKKALASKDAESGLFSLKWERVVLDEAHTIKNYSSQTANAVFDLKGHRRWCITGTPIHNEFKDMYSLVKFLQFAPFDDAKMWKKLTSDDTAASTKRRNLLVKSILLRRTKEETDDSGKRLIEMAKKSMNVYHLDLSEEEMDMYDSLKSKVDTILKKCLDKPLAKISSNQLLVLLLRLQQCCGHLSLLEKEPEDDDASDSMNDLSRCLLSLDIDGQSSSSESSLDLSLTDFQTNNLSNPRVKSTKIKKLFEMLEDISEQSNNADKSVIVSQWVSMLNIVKFHLEEDGIAYHMIAGSTKAEDRQKASDDFNTNPDGPKVMLLSLKAGGVGLNLIGGNHLFLLDLHWNPALERQACDRIHRVGQHKEVSIHKFVCRGTVEEKILKRQEDKSGIASDALHGGGKARKGLSMEDFRELFNVRF